MSRTALPALLAIALALLTGGCGDGGDDITAPTPPPDVAAPTPPPSDSETGAAPTGAASPTAPTAQPPPTRSPVTQTAPAPAPTQDAAADEQGCPGERAPEAVEDELRGDVDGDGRDDRVSLEDNVVTVTLPDGTGLRHEVLTAGPIVEVLGLADADADGRDEIFVRTRGRVGEAGVGAAVTLLVAADCRVQAITNAEGNPYSFEVGEDDDVLFGVGCVDADGDGARDLVGTRAVADGATYSWERTIVEIDGTRAANGPTDAGTFTSPQDDAAIATLAAATCGDDTLSDGLG